MIKRLVDLLFAGVVLLCFSPVIGLIYLLLKTNNKFPVFQKEERIGKEEKPITLYRFNFQDKKEQVKPEGQMILKALDLMQAFRFNLLPLFFNVLNGDLSLVGPKAEEASYVDKYDDDQRIVLTVRPGFIGPADGVLLTNEQEDEDEIYRGDWKRLYEKKTLPARLAIEAQYVKNQFLSRDWRVIKFVAKAEATRTINSQLLREAKNRNYFLPLDIFLVFSSYLIAYQLRFEWKLPDGDYLVLFKSLPLIIALRIVTFYMWGLYKNLWKYVGVKDLVNIIKAVTMSSLLAVSTIFIFGISEHSRSIFLIDWVLCITFIGGSRLVFRLFNESVNTDIKVRKNVLIIGAGDVGEMLLRELEKNARNKYNVIGFVDDDDALHGRTIHGIKVLGSCSDMVEIVKLFRVDEALITVAQFSSGQMKAILAFCKQADVRHRIVPAVSDVLSGTLHLSKFRDVEISDLFGREQVKLDLSAITSALCNHNVLVTGAGGSIGSELCRQIAEYKPAKLILVDKNENYLHEIYSELTVLHEDIKIHACLSDITNHTKQQKNFEEHKPDLVFHAAAQKHVPISEDYPDEAFINNVQGTKNIADLADSIGVKTFVMVSTDKAVNPTSVMGATKRVAELYIQSLAATSKTKFMTVRFGNVLNSNGSVVPIFKKQIERGGPVVVTHPVVERFFMSISEAVQLILQAATMGENSEIFILNMGKSIKIIDLATELIKHHGLKPYEDISIKFSGLRPGEKLFEELIGKNEKLLDTSHRDIKRLKQRFQTSHKDLTIQIKEVTAYCKQIDLKAVIQGLTKIVPEYNSKPSYSQSDFGGEFPGVTANVEPDSQTEKTAKTAHEKMA